MMLIYCPKCKTCYEIEPKLLPAEGKKMRCAKCGEVWLCSAEQENLSVPEPILSTAEQALDEQNKSNELSSQTAGEESQTSQLTDSPQDNQSSSEVQDKSATSKGETLEEAQSHSDKEDEASADKQTVKTEMDVIFARLSSQTQELFQHEKELSSSRKIWRQLKHTLELDKSGTIKYYLVVMCAIIGLLLYAMRYEVVRAFPWMNTLYQTVGIEAKVLGEGLEFQNVLRREYEEDYVRKLEIKGYIANLTEHNIDMPLIRVEILDKNTNFIQALNEKAPLETLDKKSRMAFRVVLTRPSPLAKYIILSFDKKTIAQP